MYTKENSEEYECDDYTYKIENNNLVLTEKIIRITLHILMK